MAGHSWHEHCCITSASEWRTNIMAVRRVVWGTRRCRVKYIQRGVVVINLNVVAIGMERYSHMDGMRFIFTTVDGHA